MTLHARLASATALAVIGGAAQAQITADDVWTAVLAQYAALGAEVSGTLTRDGNVVTVSAIAGSYALPMGFGSLKVVTGDVVLTENADGTVAAAIGPDWTFGASFYAVQGNDGVTVEAAFTVNTTAYTGTVSGSAGDVSILTAYDRMDITLDSLTLQGPDAMPPFDVDAYLLIEGVTSQTRLSGADPLRITTSGSIARTVIDYSFVIDGATTQSVSVTDATAYSGTISVPAGGLDLLDLAGALRAGLTIEATATAGFGRSQTLGKLGEQVISDTFQSLNSLAQTLRLNASGVEVNGALAGLTFHTRLGGVVPLAFGGTLPESSLRLQMPLLSSATPQPARFGLTMTGLALDDATWDLVAPDAPELRMPADLALDLSAQVTPRVDLVNPMDWVPMIDSADGVVVELNGMQLESLRAAYGGAVMTGSGQAAFDWSDVTQMWQVQPPTGEARFLLRGAGALLRAISASGVLAPQEMMGLRGGLAIVGRPTGPDELTAEITISPEDGLMVNGQRM